MVPTRCPYDQFSSCLKAAINSSSEWRGDVGKKTCKQYAAKFSMSSFLFFSIVWCRRKLTYRWTWSFCSVRFHMSCHVMLSIECSTLNQVLWQWLDIYIYICLCVYKFVYRWKTARHLTCVITNSWWYDTSFTNFRPVEPVNTCCLFLVSGLT